MADWIIWSNEHSAYWKPAKWGYTPNFAEAGRYSEADAKEICKAAEIGRRVDPRVPNEVCFPDPLEPARNKLAALNDKYPEIAKLFS